MSLSILIAPWRAICSKNFAHSLFEVLHLFVFATFLPIGLYSLWIGESTSTGESNGYSDASESWSGVSFNTTLGPVVTILNIGQFVTTS
ncbi:unnamed protein product [Prunus armeniaca]